KLADIPAAGAKDAPANGGKTVDLDYVSDPGAIPLVDGDPSAHVIVNNDKPAIGRRAHTSAGEETPARPTLRGIEPGATGPKPAHTAITPKLRPTPAERPKSIEEQISDKLSSALGNGFALTFKDDKVELILPESDATISRFAETFPKLLHGVKREKTDL